MCSPVLTLLSNLFCLSDTVPFLRKPSWLSKLTECPPLYSHIELGSFSLQLFFHVNEAHLCFVWFFLSGLHPSISSMEERSILLTTVATVPIMDHTFSTDLLSGWIENWLFPICCYLVHSARGGWPAQISDLALAGFWVWAEGCTSRSERKRREASGCLPPDLGADHNS